MANYAYVENDEILGVYDILPSNWKNISNFKNLENNLEELEALGWKKIVAVNANIDTAKYKILSNRHYILDGVVYEEKVVEEIPQSVDYTEEEKAEQHRRNVEEGWNAIRRRRAELIADFEWRYQRYFRNERLGLEQFDTLENMDKYMNALADITKQESPFAIIWPSYNS